MAESIAFTEETFAEKKQVCSFPAMTRGKLSPGSAGSPLMMPKPYYLALSSTTKKLDSSISDGQGHTNSVRGIKQKREKQRQRETHSLPRGKTGWCVCVCVFQ